MTQDTNLPGPVLLTGASGFLGIHLLRELLDGTDASVTCLMRGGDAQQAKSALAKKWRWYFPEAPWQAHESRVRVVLGEVGAPRLGLNARHHAELCDTHQTLVNSAGNVSHAGSDSDFFRVNTDAVATLIELSRKGAPKALHHVSTVGIVGHYNDDPPLAAFDESRLEEGQSFANAYSESKYRAEVLLRRAFAEGLSGGAYRVGFIGPHSQSGRFQQNIEHNYTTRYVRACIRLGVAPYLPENEIGLTPVDSVARAIISFAKAASGPGRAHYVETPHRVSQYDILRVIHAAGYPVRLLELEEFIDKAPRLAQDEDALSVLMPEGRGGDVHVVPVDSTRSQRALAELGFEYPPVTSAWLGKFLQHAIEVGFIEAPRFWNVGGVIGGLI